MGPQQEPSLQEPSPAAFMAPGHYFCYSKNCWRSILLQFFLTSKVMQFQLSAAAVGAVGNFSSQTSYAAGTAGDLAGTIATDGGIAITAGGAGSTAVGQFVSEITVID